MGSKKWAIFTKEDANYMINTISTETALTVYVTDLKKIWFENLSNEQLGQRFKDLNESFDFDLGECKKEVLNLVKNIGTSGTEVSLEKQSDVVSLGLNGKVLDFPLVFRFQLAVGDEETFFAEVTLPFVKTVKFLEKQNKNFCELLVKKDREISEYMLEKGDTISKKYLITEPFVIPTIDNNSLMLGIFGATSAFGGHTIGEDKKVEQPTKKLKTGTLDKKIKVYSSKTKKTTKCGINYGAKN